MKTLSTLLAREATFIDKLVEEVMSLSDEELDAVFLSGKELQSLFTPLPPLAIEEGVWPMPPHGGI